MIGLPGSFEGVIQDTASTSTLAAIITAREATGFSFNETGKSDSGTLRVYCSEQTHSSVDKAVKISGIGRKNLVKIPVRDDFFFIRSCETREAIINDKKQGYIPVCVIATIGTTGTTAIDPIKSIGEICREHKIHLHVDAAMGGTALILPEFQWMIDGKEVPYRQFRI